MLPEDTVAYEIHPPAEEDLDLVLEKVMSTVLPYVLDYIWHDQRFTLYVSHRDRCLRGQVHYGENVEDEWFVVALLKKIAEEHDKVVVRVTDQDGEPLLIEAADVLPAWAQEPDMAENRVFIYTGKVHLIPVSDRPSQLTPLPCGVPKVEDAVKVVRAFANMTEASQAIQEAIEKRLGRYPDSWANQAHYVHAILPAKASRILHQSPQLITPVIQRLLFMDNRDARVVRTMENFKQLDCVTTGVQMTRTLYAMFDHRNLWPAKRTSGWNLPSKEQENHKKAVIGFKICAAMEALAAEVKRRSVSSSDRQLNQTYVERLTQLGYFKGLLPGSKGYQELLQKATYVLSSSEEDEQATGVDTYLKEFSECLSNECNVIREEEEARAEKVSRTADAEDWLIQDQNTLDQMLREKFHLEENSQKVMGQLSDFLEASSDMKGVETEEVKSVTAADAPVDFNPDDFEAAMKKLLSSGQSDSESEDEDLEEYMDAQMEKELLGSNVKEGDELLNSMRNLKKEIEETNTGPSKTLLQSMNMQ